MEERAVIVTIEATSAVSVKEIKRVVREMLTGTLVGVLDAKQISVQVVQGAK